MISLLIH
ncbi:hypothetical protein ACHAW6_001155 [Cyclotella cf. meneghiniana]